ncbi:hypothetical protein SNEBB_009332 [Seison nebaliae]|nr:hypothetical protein SNEBB_009332 [Seison nebaliae]
MMKIKYRTKNQVDIDANQIGKYLNYLRFEKGVPEELTNILVDNKENWDQLKLFHLNKLFLNNCSTLIEFQEKLINLKFDVGHFADLEKKSKESVKRCDELRAKLDNGKTPEILEREILELDVFISNLKRNLEIEKEEKSEKERNVQTLERQLSEMNRNIGRVQYCQEIENEINNMEMANNLTERIKNQLSLFQNEIEYFQLKMEEENEMSNILQKKNKEILGKLMEKVERVESKFKTVWTKLDNKT